MKEMETIKGRELVLNLSDADCEKIFAKAAGVGLTVPQLLENFVSDLVSGTCRNGSDEHMYAEQWFDRCGFHMLSEKTFVRYILDGVFCPFWSTEELLEIMNDIEMLQKELGEMQSKPDEYKPDDIAATKEDLYYFQEQVDEIYQEFERWAELATPINRVEAIASLRQWQAEKERFIRGVQPDRQLEPIKYHNLQLEEVGEMEFEV